MFHSFQYKAFNEDLTDFKCFISAVTVDTATSEMLNIIGSGRLTGKAVVSLPATDCRRIYELNNGDCRRRSAALVFV